MQNRRLSTAVVLASALLAVAPAAARDVSCRLAFDMSGWSAFYKTASGTGRITCDNGQSMNVSVNAKGGGLTFGKQKIENGVGEFSGVKDIKELLGNYAQAEAHAGAAKSSGANVMTKGDVSLALAGTGKGWDIGVAFGKFVLEAR